MKCPQSLGTTLVVLSDFGTARTYLTRSTYIELNTIKRIYKYTPRCFWSDTVSVLAATVKLSSRLYANAEIIRQNAHDACIKKCSLCKKS